MSDEVEGLLKEAIAEYNKVFEAEYGESDTRVAGTLNNLGNALNVLGQYDEAERHYRRALEIWTTAYGELHPDVAEVAVHALVGVHVRAQYRLGTVQRQSRTTESESQ